VVICWALITALPLTIPLTVVGLAARPPRHPDTGAVAGLAYVAVVSMFLGFFAWYRGLALGGVARVGRLQVAQPVLTIGWAALLLGERLTLPGLLAAGVVLGSVAAGRAPAAHPASAPTPDRPDGAVVATTDTGRWKGRSIRILDLNP
jgi:drug/metabolite transporter (DMT)-like permease